MNNFAFIVACEEYKDPLHNLVGVEKDAELLKDTLIILCNMEIEKFGLEVIGNVYENLELLEVSE